MEDGNITTKRLHRDELDEFKTLIGIFNDVFQEMQSAADDAYLKDLLARPDFFAFAAFDEDTVIGGLTAYELPQYYKPNSELFIYDLAVSTDYQRKGIGKKLMKELQQYCDEQNIPLIFVAAHAEDKEAIDFYRSVGGSAEEVVHFNFESSN